MDFYNSSGDYVLTENLYRDTDMIYDPNWIGYESATGIGGLSVLSSTATAEARFYVFCREAVYGYSPYHASIYCN